MDKNSASPPSSASFLVPLNLGQYVAILDDEGYEVLENLQGMTLDDLKSELKMKSGHARKLAKAIEMVAVEASEIVTVAVEVSPPPPPTARIVSVSAFPSPPGGFPVAEIVTVAVEVSPPPPPTAEPVSVSAFPSPPGGFPASPSGFPTPSAPAAPAASGGGSSVATPPWPTALRAGHYTLANTGAWKIGGKAMSTADVAKYDAYRVEANGEWRCEGYPSYCGKLVPTAEPNVWEGPYSNSGKPYGQHGHMRWTLLGDGPGVGPMQIDHTYRDGGGMEPSDWNGETRYFADAAPGPLPAARERVVDAAKGRSNLVLVPIGSPRELIFDQHTWTTSHVLSGYLRGTDVRVRSPLLAITRQYTGERKAGEWRYIEAGVSDNLAAASPFSLEEHGGSIYIKHGTHPTDLVLDVSMWRFVEGNTVNWVGGKNAKKTYLPGDGRQFHFESLPDLASVGRIRVGKKGAKQSLGLGVAPGTYGTPAGSLNMPIIPQPRLGGGGGAGSDCGIVADVSTARGRALQKQWWDFLQGREFMLVPKFDQGSALDVARALHKNGSPTCVFTRHGRANQRWVAMNFREDQTFQLRPQHLLEGEQRFLNVAHPNTNASPKGTSVHLWDGDTNNARWFIQRREYEPTPDVAGSTGGCGKWWFTLSPTSNARCHLYTAGGRQKIWDGVDDNAKFTFEFDSAKFTR